MKAITIAMAAMLAAGATHGTLQDRGPLMFFDDVANLTFYKVSAAGSAFDDGFSASDGLVSWASAGAWAASLAVTNTFGVSSTGWRLPAQTEPTYAATGSAFGWYADLYDLSSNIIPTGGNSILTVNGWLVREPTHVWPPSLAWTYGKGFGVAVAALTLTDGNVFHDYGQAWAVHSGDVGAVPEPAAISLAGAGAALLGLLALRRRT
jgi:hypothetical protein